MSADLAHSLHVRLIRHARTLGVDPNLVLARYTTERLLHRLSLSPHADRFVLEGGLLLLVWLGETTRPTRDVDLLGFGDLAVTDLTTTLAEIIALEVERDGLAFESDSLRVAAIRMKDLDIHALSMHRSSDGVVLTGALRTTPERRGTEMPPSLPSPSHPLSPRSRASMGSGLASCAAIGPRQRLRTSKP